MIIIIIIIYASFKWLQCVKLLRAEEDANGEERKRRRNTVGNEEMKTNLLNLKEEEEEDNVIPTARDYAEDNDFNSLCF